MLVGHPLDTVKVKLQTQGTAVSGCSVMYRGTLHCLTETYRRERIRGLYRGLSSPLGCLAFINAIVFGVYGSAIRALGSEHSLGHQFLAGSVRPFSLRDSCSHD